MYSVIDKSGQTFGPVPLETLQQWAAEKRITGEMMVVDQTTGAQSTAAALLPALFPEAVPVASGPMAAPSAPMAPPAPAAPSTPPTGYQQAAAYTQPAVERPAAPSTIQTFKGSSEAGQVPVLTTRSVAFFIDFLLSVSLWYSLDFVASILLSQVRVSVNFLNYIGYFMPAIVAIYYLTRDAFFPGQSIGKKISGLRIVTESGMPTSIMHSVLRNAVAIPVALLPIPYVGPWVALPIVVLAFLADMFSVVTTGKRLGDNIAKTRVVNA